MKITKRILCLLMALICSLGTVCCFSACDEEQGDEGAGGLFYVTYRDVKIELNQSADSVLEKLGAPQDEDNLGDCGGIGVQIMYTYSDITVNTLKEKDGEKIHKISFINDLITTPKGIYIGSAQQDVLDAYGEPSSEDGGYLVYKEGDLELEFQIDNGKVSHINYRRIR